MNLNQFHLEMLDEMVHYSGEFILSALILSYPTSTLGPKHTSLE